MQDKLIQGYMHLCRSYNIFMSIVSYLYSWVLYPIYVHECCIQFKSWRMRVQPKCGVIINCRADGTSPVCPAIAGPLFWLFGHTSSTDEAWLGGQLDLNTQITVLLSTVEMIKCSHGSMIQAQWQLCAVDHSLWLSLAAQKQHSFSFLKRSFGSKKVTH